MSNQKKQYEIYETLTYVYVVEADSPEQAEEIFFGEAEGLVGKGALLDGAEIDIREVE